MAPYLLFTGGYVDGEILILAFDPVAGTLKEVSKASNIGNAPTWLVPSSDGKFLYAADEWGEPEGELIALEVLDEGKLTRLSTVKSGGLWPCHSGLLASATPARLLTTNYKGATLSSVALLPSGDFDKLHPVQLVPFFEQATLGPNTQRQEQAHPHGAHVDPRGVVCVVPDLGTDELRLVGIKPDGEMEALESIALESGDGPRHVLFAGEDRLYVLNELSNSISVFSYAYPPSSSASPYPSFTLLQSRVSLLPPSPMAHQSSFASWHAAELAVTPDGRTLIASNRAEGHDPLHGTREGPHDLLAVFALRRDGTLDEASRKLVDCGGRAPRHFALSSESVRLKGKGDKAVEEGRYLAVANHDSDDIVVFERTGEAGRELREVARREGVARAGIVLWA
ncbi:hypothetical protein JCM10207_004450 [Rhodosporidiobolus poonsookiae]